MKPVVYEDIPGPFPGTLPKYQKSIRFSVKLKVDLLSRKALTFLVTTAFCKNGIRPAENHMKPVVYEDFPGPIPERLPKGFKKAVGF